MGLKAVNLLQQAGKAITAGADDVARYAKACGKRSILKTKPLSKGFKIDPSKLGYEYKKGKYIFATDTQNTQAT